LSVLVDAIAHMVQVFFQDNLARVTQMLGVDGHGYGHQDGNDGDHDNDF
jgi:hypothetical protein